MEYRSRKDVPDKYKFDLTFMYKNDKEHAKELGKISSDLDIISNKKETFLDNADNLYEVLELFFKVSNKLDDVYVYASLNLDTELSNNDNMVRYGNVINLLTKFDISTNYILTELIKIDLEKLEQFYKDNTKLEKYRNFVNRTLKMKEHMLSEREENLVSLLTNNYSKFPDIADNLTDSTLNYGYIELSDGKKHELTSGNFRSFLMNEDRDVRRQAFLKFNSKLYEFRDIYANSLIGYLDSYNKISDIRGYKNVLDMETFSDNIPTLVHDTVNTVCMNNLESYRRYFRMIKKYSGLNELHSYDILVPITHSNKEYTIEEAEEIIKKSLSILGNEYLEKLNFMFKNHRIDYAEYKGKKSGAYEISTYNFGPVVFTNYKNKFSDISGIAHELGHAVHSLFSDENNTDVENQYTIFVAEVASLTNEILLSDYIVRNSDDNNEKLACIYNMLDIIENNFFDAVLEGKFEDIVHEKIRNNETLTADSFDEILLNLRQIFYGDTVIIDKYLESRWARRQHYYRPFYLYKYATGITAAIYFATNILNGNKEVLDKYIEFLKMGSRYYPNEELMMSGVDLTKEDIYLNTVNYFDELIDKFEEIKEVM